MNGEVGVKRIVISSSSFCNMPLIDFSLKGMTRFADIPVRGRETSWGKSMACMEHYLLSVFKVNAGSRST